MVTTRHKKLVALRSLLGQEVGVFYSGHEVYRGTLTQHDGRHPQGYYVGNRQLVAGELSEILGSQRIVRIYKQNGLRGEKQ